MRRQDFLIASVTGAVVSLSAGALAQPMLREQGAGGGMPNLKAIVGRPLPDQGMPTGTVSVRVARKQPSNPVANVEVTVITKNAGGDARKRTLKTDAGGRAIFEGLATGDEFRAQVSVDGESLATESFPIPSQGGVRTMLIAALGASGGGDEAASAGQAGAGEGEGKAFAMGVSAGAAFPDTALPTGTLEVKPLDEGGAPIPNHAVVLGSIGKDGKMDVHRAKTDGSGVARFTGLATGEGNGYAAVLEWKGLRLGTLPFVMPAEGGARAEIRAFARTNDPSVVAISDGARIVVQLRDDRLEILEMLPLENRSDLMFDPGVGAIEIPLPEGFVGASPGNREGEHRLEVRQNHGIAVHGVVPPKQAVVGGNPRENGQEVEFGFVLPYHGDEKDFVQPMPNGIGGLTLITEQIAGLSVIGNGVGARQERELGGRKYWVMPVEAVPPGGKLAFTLRGLPSTDSTGRNVAGVLALGLIVAGFAFGRRPESGRAGGGAGRRESDSERAKLIDKREVLFTSLVSLERETRANGGAADDRRKQLVADLEQVYRRLAAMEEQRAA